MRKALVDAANHAIQHHWHWKKEFERLSFRLGRSKAVVAIARKLLITVWHILTREAADRHADPHDMACSLFKHAYRVQVKNLGGLSTKQFTEGSQYILINVPVIFTDTLSVIFGNNGLFYGGSRANSSL